MTDFYSEESSVVHDQETQRHIWYQRFAMALAVSFFAPIYFSAFGTSKFVFPNIEIIGKVSTLATIVALYPLFAAIIVIVAILKTEDTTRSMILLFTGLFPIILALVSQEDAFSSSMNSMFKANLLFLLTTFSIMGVYVGAKVTEEIGISGGQQISGVCGIIFMGLLLLPIEGIPAYFKLFKLFKSTGYTGFPVSATFLAITTIAICSAYLYGCFMAVMNMRNTNNPAELAERIQRLLLWATIAFPVALILLNLFSPDRFGMKMSISTFLFKYILEIGAIIGLIVLPICDLIEQCTPPTLKGSDLFKTSS